MLSIQGDRRPSAPEILSRLSSVALFENSAAISERFTQILSDEKSTTLGAEIECTRFESWRYALDLLEETTTVGIRNDLDFESTRTILLQLEDALAGTRLLLSGVRLLIDRLWDILTADEKESAEAHFDEQLFRGKYIIEEGPETAFFDSRRKTVLKIKQMTGQLEKSKVTAGPQSFEIDHRIIEIEGEFGDHRIGIIKQSGGEQAQRVLIERREPTSVSSKEESKEGRRFVKYTEQLCELLGIKKPPSFHALTCRGFVRDKNAALGLVFNFPAGDPQHLDLKPCLSTK